MSKLLINEYPLQVLPSLAAKIGLNEALFLQQLHYWLTPRSLPNGQKWEPQYREYENVTRPWIFNSFDKKVTKTGKEIGWTANFPFWSARTIMRIVRNLEELKLIITTDKFSHSPRGRMLWYTIDYEKFRELEKEIEQDKSSDCQVVIPSNQDDILSDFGMTDCQPEAAFGMTDCQDIGCQVVIPSETTPPQTTKDKETTIKTTREIIFILIGKLKIIGKTVKELAALDWVTEDYLKRWIKYQEENDYNTPTGVIVEAIRAGQEAPLKRLSLGAKGSGYRIVPVEENGTFHPDIDIQKLRELQEEEEKRAILARRRGEVSPERRAKLERLSVTFGSTRNDDGSYNF